MPQDELQKPRRRRDWQRWVPFIIVSIGITVALALLLGFAALRSCGYVR